MRSPKVSAALTVALVIVAAVFVVIDGPSAAVYPAVFATCWALMTYLNSRYPPTLKRWSRRRVIDTSAVIGLGFVLIIVGGVLSRPATSTWAFPVTALVVFVFAAPGWIADLVREARGRPQSAPESSDHHPGPAG